MGRFGIQFVASPRHADGIVITGPVSGNMKEALIKTYEAVPAPKIVIAVGAAAISGGIFRGHPEVSDGTRASCRSTSTYRAIPLIRSRFSMGSCV